MLQTTLIWIIIKKKYLKKNKVEAKEPTKIFFNTKSIIIFQIYKIQAFKITVVVVTVFQTLI